MLRALIMKFGGSALGSWIHDAASGKRGDFLKDVYWALAGKKLLLGFCFGGIAVAVSALGGNVEVLTWLAGVFVGAGLLDKAWRSETPWETMPFWCLVRDHSADVIAVLGSLGTYFATCDGATAALLAKVHLSCKVGVATITAITAIFSWMLGEAKTSKAPAATV